MLGSLAETALSAAYLTVCMDRSFSRRQMLLLDCSYRQVHSTPLNNELDSRGGLPAAFKGRGYGRVVLAATHTVPNILTGDEIVGETTDPGFTHYLMQGLQTGAADMDQDGQIELRELYKYIQSQSGQAISLLQPYHRTYGNWNKFIIARNRHRFAPARSIKWDLIFGAIMAPTAIIVIGSEADFPASIGMAGLFLLLYAFLYQVLE